MKWVERSRRRAIGIAVGLVVAACCPRHAAAHRDAGGELVAAVAAESGRAIDAAAWTAAASGASSPVPCVLDEVEGADALRMLVTPVPARGGAAWGATRAGAGEAAYAQLDDDDLEALAALLVREFALTRLDDAALPASMVAEIVRAAPRPCSNPLADPAAVRDFRRFESLGRLSSVARQRFERALGVQRDALALALAARDRWDALLAGVLVRAACAEGRAIVELARAEGLAGAGWSTDRSVDDAVAAALALDLGFGEPGEAPRAARSVRDRVGPAIAAARSTGAECAALRGALDRVVPVRRERIVAMAMDPSGGVRIGRGAAEITVAQIARWRALAGTGPREAAVRPSTEARPRPRPRLRDAPFLRPPPRAAADTLASMSSASERYRRQMQLPGFGAEGQARLRAGSALVVGAGALGTVVLEQLCRAGIGTLVVVDRDVVEQGNLQRQTLYTESDASRRVPKAEAAKARLASINGEVVVRAFVDDLHSGNARRYAERCDLLIDCVDNFESRYLMNDCAVQLGLPFIYGGAVGTRGMAAALLPVTGGAGRIVYDASQATPCLRCIAPDPPSPAEVETCETGGILAASAGIVGSIEAASAIALLAQGVAAVPPVLVRFDLARGDFHSSSLAGARDPECPCCVEGRFEHLGASGRPWRVLCGRNAVETRLAAPMSEGDAARVAGRLQAFGSVAVDRAGDSMSVRCAFSQAEVARCGIHAITLLGASHGTLAIVEGTTDPERARAELARLVGV